MKPERKLAVVIGRDEDGNYLASFPALHGCHTYASTLGTLMKRAREAAELYLEVGEVDDSLEFIGIQQISI